MNDYKHILNINIIEYKTIIYIHILNDYDELFE